MKGMRDISTSYHSRASEEEMKSIQDFFDKLDVDRDGKVSRLDLKESRTTVSASLSADNVFEKLDANGDGLLDFDEVKCLYYMVHKVQIPRCCGCYDLLTGPYFSCLRCAGKSPQRYDLCCACYRAEGHESAHEHEIEHMVDNHTLTTELIADLRNNAATPAPAAAETVIIVEGENMKKEMDELRETAKAHYRAGSPEVQDLAYDFFKSMDTDGDGRVNLSEFLAFMRAQEDRYSNMRNRYFFDELDKDSNGTLDFSEVMALYYIIKSRRPFCDFCGKFIPGIFFSCVECFNNSSGAPFDLCPVCYKAKSCKHEHDGRVQFLDNYTLLETKRDSGLALATSLNTNQQLRPGTSTSTSTAVLQHSYSSPSLVPNNAIVPAASNNNWSKWKVSLTALEIAIHATILSGTCTIL